jgi:hypothetical protein
MRLRMTTCAIGLCVGLSLTACFGPLYKVAPLPKTPPDEMTTTTTNVTGAGLEIGALMLNDEQAYARFSANLPLAGVIAVEMRIVNRTTEQLSLKQKNFTLRDSEGHKLRMLEPKNALTYVMDYYGAQLYGLEAYRQTRAAYESIALATRTPLAPGEERRGMLYFALKPPVTDTSGLVLTFKGRGTQLQLPLK